jgi:hypothetical protein
MFFDERVDFFSKQRRNRKGKKSRMMRLDNQKITRLLEIIERNKWEILRREAENDTPEDEPAEDLEPKDVKLVLYAAQTPLTDSLVSALSHETVITAFDDPERLISFCSKYQIKFVLLDLDPPCSCHTAFDIFSALKIIDNSITFFACAKRIGHNEKQYLLNNGVTILEKPILRKHIEWIILQINSQNNQT